MTLLVFNVSIVCPLALDRATQRPYQNSQLLYHIRCCHSCNQVCIIYATRRQEDEDEEVANILAQINCMRLQIKTLRLFHIHPLRA